MYCDEILINVIIRTVNLEMTLLLSYHIPRCNTDLCEIELRPYLVVLSAGLDNRHPFSTFTMLIRESARVPTVEIDRHPNLEFLVSVR